MKHAAVCLMFAATLAIHLSLLAGESRPLPTDAPARIELRDQFEAAHKLTFPTTNVTLLTIADRNGAAQVDAWIAALKPRYGGRVAIHGLADVGGVPGFVQGRVRKGFQETRKHPVMLDWSGRVCAQLGYQRDVANILVLDRNGVIQARFTGAATSAAVALVSAALDKVLAAPSQ
jgi:hypothetical protein